MDLNCGTLHKSTSIPREHDGYGPNRSTASVPWRPLTRPISSPPRSRRRILRAVPSPPTHRARPGTSPAERPVPGRNSSTTSSMDPRWRPNPSTQQSGLVGCYGKCWPCGWSVWGWLTLDNWIMTKFRIQWGFNLWHIVTYCNHLTDWNPQSQSSVRAFHPGASELRFTWISWPGFCHHLTLCWVQDAPAIEYRCSSGVKKLP